ncbi:MAG: ATP-binding protein [Halobacteriota archaeon]
MRATSDEPIKVLLIEDTALDVRLVTELLHDASHDRFTVITASTLAQGLKLLSATSVGVILLDLGLPDSQGLDTFHAVHKQASNLPIVVLTIADDDVLGQQLVQEGAQDYLPKDVLEDEMGAAMLTRMIRYAIERKRADVALSDVQRLAGIGESASMIGHDLRNPLQAMQYILDLQKLRFGHMPPETRALDDWQNVQVLCEKMSEQIYYMDKIVSDLQDYARPVAPEREQVAISTLINEVLESLPHTDGVETTVDAHDLIITADPYLMRRVFANLILNAVQAMPEGGRLMISATTADDSVAISVRDTGVGIPEEMIDTLFSPLATGKAKGTGLGLAVVKRIVEAHNSTITFESEEGKGTTFTVTLPKISP